tara:strand:+ start:277 stop:495 length:219 start_codon:yes stop_codon:yes gene_type:complete
MSYRSGRVIEEGVVNGIPYRIWQSWNGKKIVFSGNKKRSPKFPDGRGIGKGHGMKWLKKQKKIERLKEENEE